MLGASMVVFCRATRPPSFYPSGRLWARCLLLQQLKAKPESKAVKSAKPAKAAKALRQHADEVVRVVNTDPGAAPGLRSQRVRCPPPARGQPRGRPRSPRSPAAPRFRSARRSPDVLAGLSLIIRDVSCPKFGRVHGSVLPCDAPFFLSPFSPAVMTRRSLQPPERRVSATSHRLIPALQRPGTGADARKRARGGSAARQRVVTVWVCSTSRAGLKVSRL